MLLGAILGFLPFNFYPASIFMGDSGSLFIGFLLSALAMAAGQEVTTNLGDRHSDIGFRPPDSRRDPGRHAPLAPRRIPCSAAIPTTSTTNFCALAYPIVKPSSSCMPSPPHLSWQALRSSWTKSSCCLSCSPSFSASFVGVQQLHYPEFSGLFRPGGRRRQIVTDAPSLRRASEALAACPDFRSICQVLQETLQPDGFEGLRLKNLGKDGFPMALFQTLHYNWEGKWFLEWSERKTDDSPWEYSFQLIKNPQPTLGYASFFHMSPREDFRLNADMLAADFRTALSDAVARAVTRNEALHQTEQNAELNLVRAACRAAD